MRHVNLLVLQLPPSGEDLTTYRVTLSPPVDVGGSHLIVALPRAPLALTARGLPGPASGRATADGDEAGPVPTTFTATTVKVYSCPLVKPVMEHSRVPGEKQLAPPGLDVATYLMIGVPPVDAGPSQVTVADPRSPVKATTPEGAPGNPRGVTGLERTGALEPNLVAAEMTKV